MFEYGAVFTLVGADGTTVVFNDGLSGLVLEDISGFDSPTIRTNVEDLPEGDGAIAGDSFYGQRPVTLSGRIVGVSASGRNQTILNLQRALRGLRSDLTLKAQPSGLPAMQTTARIAGLRITGAFVKQFLISLICADPLMYSQALNSSTLTQAQSPPTPGAAFPWSFPINWGGGIGAYSVVVSATNAGNFDTPATFKIWGPITNPYLVDASTLDALYLDGVTLNAGEWMAVDTRARSVSKSDGTNWYGSVRFPDSKWLLLRPGSTSVQLWGTLTSAATELDINWRDAWI